MRRLAPILAVWASLAWAQDVVPPEVTSRVEARLPVGAPPPLQDHILLEFTVGTDGAASDIAVVESAGEAWDTAAIRALAQWRFNPARHAGTPVAARTRLAFSVPVSALDAGAVDAPQELDGGDGAARPSEGPVEADAGVPSTSEVAAPDGGPPVFGVEGALVGPSHPAHELSTTVLGRVVPKSRGASDFHLEVGELKSVPRRSASELLTLAPGILLTNEGGEGHAEQIFLRGFDAREGQDLELTVDGVPINDAGNLHGNGFANLHFLIPELVENLRVLEGPFDPRQGNFAVAGSADYQLGLAQRGLLAKGAVGSFETSRLVLLWGPPGETSRTFGGVEVFRTSGFGQNRAALDAKAMGQYEGRLSDSTSFRVGAAAYGANFRSAGLVRADDVASGAKGFYDTYDERQGGDNARAQAHLDLHSHGTKLASDHTVFALYQLGRLRENFTGFLADVQLPQQNLHGQRGDLIDRTSSNVTMGARGAARFRGHLFGRTQELEGGYFARLDLVEGLQERVQAGGNTPYLRELDLQSTLTDIGAYLDASLSPWWWLTLRGGARVEVLTYDVHDRCAAREVRRPSTSDPPGDASCLSQQDLGRYREPDERHSTTGAVILPRGSILVGPFAGATLTGSVGQGVRSIDPQYVTQNLEAPFASVLAWEGGVSWAHAFERHALTARLVLFGTRVDKDLVFNEQEGRGILGGSTSRLGALAAGRAKGSFYDVNLNVTWVRSQFDDSGLLVPYVPDLVVRGDGAIFHQLPWWRPLGAPLSARASLGVTYVGRRALPYGQRSDVILVGDASLEGSWKWLSLGLSVRNLLDTQYRLGEYNFASDFRTSGTLPTLVPARMFSAGAPRSFLLTLGVQLGDES